MVDFLQEAKDFLYKHVGEIVFAIFFPFHATVALACAVEAFVSTHAFFGGHQNNYKSNAYLHAYWNCAMTRSMNVLTAKTVADAHEIWGGNPEAEKQMDLHNNQIGRILAIDPLTLLPKGVFSCWHINCAERVLKALELNKLRWLLPEPNF